MSQSSSASQRHLNVVPTVETERGEVLQLRIRDSEVLEALSRCANDDDKRAFALRALKIGVVALNSASTTIDVQKLRDEGGVLVQTLRDAIDAHRRDVEERVEKTLSAYLDPSKGKLNERLRALTSDEGELVRALQSQVSGEDSRLAKVLKLHVGSESALLKKLDPSSESGVIVSMRDAVNDVLKDYREQVNAQFDQNNQDSAISRLLRGVKSLNDELGSNFSLDNEKSALNKLKLMLKDTQDRIGEELSLNNEKGALYRVDERLKKQMDTFLESFTAFQTEIRGTLEKIEQKNRFVTRTTLKGYEFEQVLADAVTKLFPQDRLEVVGDGKGLLGRSKVGDIRITLGDDTSAPGARIVIEAKDSDAYNRRSKATEELRLAIDNRDAEIGVFILHANCVKTWTEQNKVHDWQKPLQRFDNEIYLVWDPESEFAEPLLEAAISLARGLCIRAAAEVDHESEADWEAIDSAMLEIEKQVDRFESIAKSCDAIEKAVETIRDELRKTGKKLKVASGRLGDELGVLRESDQGSESEN